ncbi:MAG TPA: response regulator transcription factor [Ignavibacteriaceae bacterium]|nr:response regulator transcription factor [Ignavibacteriaceae bacterium]
MITILIVDDHPIVAEGIRKLIQDSNAAEVIGVAGTGKACLDFLRWEKPDVILLDISLPDISGIDLCKVIKTKEPSRKILALTTFNERSTVINMMKNGADGYILKNSETSEIIEAIQEVYKGGKYICDSAEELLKEEVINDLLLTNREKEVLRLIADGFTNLEIGNRLFISPLTVDSHRKNLITKLKARNTASLIRIASDKGLL